MEHGRRLTWSFLPSVSSPGTWSSRCLKTGGTQWRSRSRWQNICQPNEGPASWLTYAHYLTSSSSPRLYPDNREHTTSTADGSLTGSTSFKPSDLGLWI